MSKYHTIELPIDELTKIDFLSKTGLELKEDSFKILVEYEEGGDYKFFALNNKLIIYNKVITLTDNLVTPNSLEVEHGL